MAWPDPKFDPMAEPEEKPHEFDPFAISYGQGQQQPIGWSDPRGERPSEVDRIMRPGAVQAEGEWHGLMARAKRGGEVGEWPEQGEGRRQPPTLGELLGTDIPMFQRSGSSTVQVTPAKFSKEEAAGYTERVRKAGEVAKDAELNKTIIERAKQNDMAELARRTKIEREAEQARFRLQEMEVEAQSKERMQENLGMLKEIRESKVDPDRRYSGEYGTMRRVADALAVALGQFGASMQGGGAKNVALEIINRAVDKDIQAQVQELSNKKWQYQEGRNLVADLMAKGRSLREAANIARLKSLEELKLEQDAIASKYGSRISQENMMASRAAIDEQVAKTEMAIQADSRDQVIRSRTSGARQMTGPAQAAAKALLAERMAAAGMGGGGSGKPPSDKVMEELQSRNDTIKKVENVESLISKKGYGLAERRIPNTEANRLRETVIIPFLAEMRKSIETGVMTENDWKRYKQVLDATWSTSTEVLARVRQIKGELRGKQQGALKSYGYYYDVSPYEQQFKGGGSR